MNKLIIGLGILVIAVFSWVAFHENTIYYVATIDNEVTALEDELIKIDAEVTAGTLSSETATVARVSIVTRLEKINVAVAESKSKELTPEQKKMLVEGLDRLKDILVKYKDTLIAVENTASIKTDITSSTGKRHTSITAVLNETIDNVEENVIEVVEEYVSEDSDSTDANENDEQTVEDTQIQDNDEPVSAEEPQPEEIPSEVTSPINIIDPSLGIDTSNQPEPTGDIAIEADSETTTEPN